MRILAFTWAGVRTADLEATTHFFSDILGLSLTRREERLAQFELPSGQLFEIFGAKSRYYGLHACPVLAFQVEDLRAARQEMEAHGVQFETDIEGDETEQWTYFRGPDGYVYELWQTQRRLQPVSPVDLRL